MANVKMVEVAKKKGELPGTIPEIGFVPIDAEMGVFWSAWSSAMDFRFKENDWVVYTREKHSVSPGRRAKNIAPSAHGDMYSYQVDKYWVVRQVLPESLVLETRTGKQHRVSRTDRRLRHPSWWERLFYADRFPRKAAGATRTIANRPA